MEVNKINTCCFIGHRKINVTDGLVCHLEGIIESLIVTEKVDTFLFGSRSEFNELCLNSVTNLKKKYPHIKRIYVRAEFPYIDDTYKSYLLEQYEDTYYPERIKNAGKAIYIERNREMIDNSSYCITYYIPHRRTAGIKGDTECKYVNGTEYAYYYAQKKGITVFNVTE